MEVPMKVTFVKVRKVSDLQWVTGDHNTLYVKPHPEVSEKDKKELIEAMAEYENVQILVDAEVLANVDPVIGTSKNVTQSICVLIRSHEEITHMFVRGASGKTIFIIPYFNIPNEFKKQMVAELPSFGISGVARDWFENSSGNGWITTALTLGSVYMVATALMTIYAHVRDSGSTMFSNVPLLQIQSISVPDINLFRIENLNVKDFFSRGGFSRRGGD